MDILIPESVILANMEILLGRTFTSVEEIGDYLRAHPEERARLAGLSENLLRREIEQEQQRAARAIRSGDHRRAALHAAKAEEYRQALKPPLEGRAR